MSWWSRKKRKVPEPARPKTQQAENPLYASTDPSIQAFRRRVLYTTGTIVAGIVIGLAIYGPWLRVTDVQIRGTRLLDPRSLQSVTQTYLDSQRWLLIPNRNVWLLSRGHLANYLTKKISQRLSIEQVSVKKSYPHTITVTVAERVPIVRWQSGQQQVTVDRHGVVIESIQTDTTDQIPLVQDQSGRSVTIGQQVIAANGMAAIQEIQRLLTERQRKIEYFIVPLANCPAPPVIAPEETPPGDQTNSNLNAAQTPVVNVNQDTNLAGQSDLGVNASSAPDLPVCDQAKLQLESVEIHVQLADGPKLLFDRLQDLPNQVAIAERVLEDPDERPSFLY